MPSNIEIARDIWRRAAAHPWEGSTGHYHTCIEAEVAKAIEDAVLAERARCLRVLELNNDNDAHRYYIEHPEFFSL